MRQILPVRFTLTGGAVTPGGLALDGLRSSIDFGGTFVDRAPGATLFTHGGWTVSLSAVAKSLTSPYLTAAFTVQTPALANVALQVDLAAVDLFTAAPALVQPRIVVSAIGPGMLVGAYGWLDTANGLYGQESSAGTTQLDAVGTATGSGNGCFTPAGTPFSMFASLYVGSGSAQTTSGIISLI